MSPLFGLVPCLCAGVPLSCMAFVLSCMFIRFSTERSPDLASASLGEATDHLEISKDAQRRVREGQSLVGSGCCWAHSTFSRQMRIMKQNSFIARGGNGVSVAFQCVSHHLLPKYNQKHVTKKREAKRKRGI